MGRLSSIPAIVCGLLFTSVAAAQTTPLKILFLGDKGHHQPALRYRQLQPVLQSRGITLEYFDGAAALNPKTLSGFDGLLIYANIEKIAPEQESALLDYVASGKGLIPVHCASYCFLNSPKYVELVGAQFKSHGAGTFRTISAKVEHPILKGYSGFESWDETYTHVRHNEKDRTVLEYREEGDRKEPWTWTRTHVNGRVFYTAWGHDDRTWSNAGFHNLIERGIRWATGGDPTKVVAFRDRPEMTQPSKDVAPFEYADAKLPFYPPGKNAGISTKRPTQMQLPISPAESMKHASHPVDFELKLFASEPMIRRPICMAWDERGRLWISESIDYPNELKRKGEGRDRIVILEDTDGDGLADKTTVFADKLSIPTSMAFHRGGVIVHQAPNTLFLKDTNGDDVADVREVLFTGWSTGDTHAGPSNLQWGLDNWLYGTVGYSGFQGKIGATDHSFRTGFYRFKVTTPCCGDGPDDVAFEFLRNTNNNTWGLGLSEEGIVFGSTANGNPSNYMPVPNRFYESVRGWSSRVLAGIAGNAPMYPITDKVRQVDWHGHFTAAAGHALYTARAYPPEYWNRAAFICEPTGHLIATFQIQGKGADFKSRNAWNLFASRDEWSSPILAEVGPDGNVWFVDWYNYIIQHNPTPPGFSNGKGNAYETDLRDKKHGRIYRLAVKGAKQPAFTLKDATPKQLVATLKNDNLFWRRHAQRLLVERGQKDVVPELVALVNDRSTDAIGLNPGAMHALWTLEGLGAYDGKSEAAWNAIVGALSHPSAGVRRNAALALPRTAAGLVALLKSNVTNDGDGQVRLAALLSLAEMPPASGAGDAAASALRKADVTSDPWLADAVTSAAARHDVHFLRAMLSNPEKLNDKANESLRIVAEHWARGGSAEGISELVAALPKGADPAREMVLQGLAKGWPRSKAPTLSAEAEKALLGMLTTTTPSGRATIVRLATQWKLKAFEKQRAELARSLLTTISDEKKSEADRVAAAKQAVELDPSDNALAKTLTEVITPRSSPEFTAGVMEALAMSSAPEAGPAMVEKLPTFSPVAKQAALRAILSRPEATRAFVRAASEGKASLADLSLDQKQALSVHPDMTIAKTAKDLLAKGGGLPSPDRQKVFEAMLPSLKTGGEHALGKEMFKKHCAVCHSHSGEGQKIGPDLTGVAVHSREHLLTDILDPSRNVEGNYRVYTVATNDGRVFSGLLASETKTSIELIDTQAKKHVLLRDDIEQMIASKNSLMPDGFEKQMTPDELRHLLAFLTQPGKYVPLSLAKVASVVSTKGMFFASDSTVERLILKDWNPRTVKGVPFHFVDPSGDRVPNVVLLYGPQGSVPPKMPKSVSLPCNLPIKAVHLLSGVSGWGFPASGKGSHSMTVRLNYADGQTEDHKLINGEHFADYIRRVDVPGSAFAFQMRGQQMRYLSVTPKRNEPLASIDLVKGSDVSSPIVLAVTVETR